MLTFLLQCHSLDVVPSWYGMNEDSIYDASVACSNAYNTLYKCESDSKTAYLQTHSKFPPLLKDQLQVQCVPCQNQNRAMLSACESDVRDGNSMAFLLGFQCQKENNEYCFSQLYNAADPTKLLVQFDCNNQCHVDLAKYLVSQNLTNDVNYTKTAIYDYGWNPETIKSCFSATSVGNSIAITILTSVCTIVGLMLF